MPQPNTRTDCPSFNPASLCDLTTQASGSMNVL